METLQWSMSSISSVIHISVAPVFLLTGIAALINIMINRLGRIIDRSRVLQHTALKTDSKDSQPLLIQELAQLSRRARLIYIAVCCATISALTVCMVVMALFLGDFSASNFSQLVASLFIICMVLLITALIFFLMEVFISIRAMRKEISFEIFEPNAK